MHLWLRTFCGVTAASCLLAPLLGLGAVQAPVVTRTNTTIRVMAANLTGSSQSYQPFALRIFQGLKPDVVAVQEFNYGNNTPAEFRALLDGAFGTNYTYYRETGAGYSIPNGIISRYPIAAAGSWDDLEIPDRGFAWARLTLPGPTDLCVVSVHFKASSGDAGRRLTEASNLTALVAANVPAGAWLVVAGDLNTSTRSEAALTQLKTFLSDSPIPTDAPSGGNSNTSEPRSKPYDYVLPSFNFLTNQVPTLLGSQSFPNGLVFDSAVFSPLSEVAPILAADSHQAQHMAVLKDFRVNYLLTNWVPVPPPVLAFSSSNVVHWTGPSHLSYTLETSTTLTNWTVTGTATSATTHYTHTNSAGSAPQAFWRVRYP